MKDVGNKHCDGRTTIFKTSGATEVSEETKHWRGKQLFTGGGGTSILTVSGTCRWTGYDFPVITIDTGYLNRPNWLLAGYSVYHRVVSHAAGFPAHNVYVRPANSASATVRAGRNRFLWMYNDHTQQNRQSVRTSTNEPWINARSQNSPSSLSLSQGMHMKVFSKVYCDRVYFLCAERFETGSGLFGDSTVCFFRVQHWTDNEFPLWNQNYGQDANDILEGWMKELIKGWLLRKKGACL